MAGAASLPRMDAPPGPRLLAAKLGVGPNARLLLLGAPRGWSPGPLPDGADVTRRGVEAADVVLAFCADLDALAQAVDAAAELRAGAAFWLAWPKRASGVVTDVTEGAVRSAGLSTGLVDVKIAAIDPTWSGLKFVHRRPR